MWGGVVSTTHKGVPKNIRTISMCLNNHFHIRTVVDMKTLKY